MNSKFTIYGDSATECLWFISLNARFKGVSCFNIRYRGQNPKKIEELISLSRPDIILCKDGNPILVLEKTSETGTGHNQLQRFDRLANSSEKGVPNIYVHPYLSKKHGEHSQLVSLNVRLLKALINLTEANSCPSISIKIPLDEDDELDYTKANNELRIILDNFLSKLDKKENYNFKSEIEKMQKEYKKGCKATPQYLKPPKSVSVVNTSEVLKEVAEKKKQVKGSSNNFKRKTETLVYRIGDKGSKPRTDPFTGAGMAYDYLYTRNKYGVKEKNLVAKFCGSKDEPTISLKWFIDNYPHNNSKLATYYSIFDALVFHDGIYYCDFSPKLLYNDEISNKKFIFNGSFFFGFTKEEEVYVRFKDFMLKDNWRLISGDPPKGTEDKPVLEIKPHQKSIRGSRGSVKPDAVFIQEKKILFIEFKEKYDAPDESRMLSFHTKQFKLYLIKALKEKQNIIRQLRYPLKELTFRCGIANADLKEVDPRLLHYFMNDKNKFIVKNNNSLLSKFHI